MRWEDLREEEFEEAVKISGGVCVVPIGCVEKHGQHLPVGTDTQTCNYVAVEAAKKEPVVVFPAMYFGDVMGHTVWRGGITLSSELLLKMLTEVASEIARNGFKKIVFLNGHGGNVAFLRYFVRSTQYKLKDYVVTTRNEYSYTVSKLVGDIDKGESFPELTDEDIAFLRDFVYNKKVTGHGCINETSVMMVINGENVKLDRADAESGMPNHKTDYLADTGLLASTRFWGIEYENSYQGESVEGANERIGRAILRKRIEHQAEACRLLKMDDRILEWNDEWNKRSEWCKTNT